MWNQERFVRGGGQLLHVIAMKNSQQITTDKQYTHDTNPILSVSRDREFFFVYLANVIYRLFVFTKPSFLGYMT